LNEAYLTDGYIYVSHAILSYISRQELDNEFMITQIPNDKPSTNKECTQSYCKKNSLKNDVISIGLMYCYYTNRQKLKV
jgi:hypothetical protein